MRVPMSWLREYVDINVSTEELATRLSAIGVAIEYIENRNPGIHGIYVAEIVKVEKHPDADRLRVTQCNLGDRQLQIVTAAPNIQQGHKIPLSVEGAKVLKEGKPFDIKKSKLRGVESFGMMCSADELGIPSKDLPAEQREGVLILPPDSEPGADVVKLLGIDEQVLVVEPFANRPDYLSIYGIAREVAALLGVPLKPLKLDFPEVSEAASDMCTVTVQNADLCPRYVARVVLDARVGPSPLWMQGRLAAAGMRAINRVVDVTNYVMLEVGQPLHAFDYDRLDGHQIHVRQAHANERIKTIDGDERTLSDSMLVIADRSRPVAVAGVMGGLDSEVCGETRTVLLEAANFNPVSVRRTGAALGMRSESSKRFEKGLSWHGVDVGSRRAAVLLAQLGCRVAQGAVEAGHGAPLPASVDFKPEAVGRILGVPVPVDRIKSILARLEFICHGSDTAMQVVVPAHRLDVRRDVDLVEEVARHFGYNNVPSTLPGGRFAGGAGHADRGEEHLRDLLSRLGLYEAITPTLYRKDSRARFGFAEVPEIKVHNPLSEEQHHLRSTVLVHLLDVALHNIRARQTALRFFELSRVYEPLGPTEEMQPDTPPGVAQRRRLGLLWWGGGQDFFLAKGAIEAVADACGASFEVTPAEVPGFHPGKTAHLYLDREMVGVLGVLHPQTASQLEVEGDIVLAELDVAALLVPRVARNYESVARFPAAERDLAVVFEDRVSWAQVKRAVQGSAGSLLRDVACFDVYRGESIPAGHKSVAFRMVYQAGDRTLTDAEVDKAVGDVVRVLQQTLAGQVRS